MGSFPETYNERAGWGGGGGEGGVVIDGWISRQTGTGEYFNFNKSVSRDNIDASSGICFLRFIIHILFWNITTNKLVSDVAIFNYVLGEGKEKEILATDLLTS